MSKNPFAAPPKPPKRPPETRTIPSNPFDDDDENGEVTVTFPSPARTQPHGSYQQSAPPINRKNSDQRNSYNSPPFTQPRRTFGGSIQAISNASTSLVARAREQLSRSSSYGGNSQYAPVSADMGSTAPMSPFSDEPVGYNASVARSPLAARSLPISPALVRSPAQHQGHRPLPAPPAIQAATGRRMAAPPEVSGCDDVEGGLELTEIALHTESTIGSNSRAQGTHRGSTTRDSLDEDDSDDPKHDGAEEQRTRRGKWFGKGVGKGGCKRGGKEKEQGDKGQQQNQKKKKKTKTRRKIVCVDPADENAVIRHLLSERVYGYPHTYGGRLSNFRYYVQYNHPILGIYFVHPLHPFSRRQRFIVFLCTLSFAVCFAFLIMATPLVPMFETCRSVCHCEVLSDDPQQQASREALFGAFAGTTGGAGGEPLEWTGSGRQLGMQPECVGGSNDGISCDAYNEICGNYRSWMLSFFCGGMTTMYESLLRFLATCSCLQGRKRFQNNCLGARIKAMIEYCGGVTLFFFSCLSAVFTLLTIALCWYEGIAAEVLVVMVLSELWSTVQWIVWAAPWFLYQYPKDRRTFYEKLRRRSSRHRSAPIPEEV